MSIGVPVAPRGSDLLEANCVTALAEVDELLEPQAATSPAATTASTPTANTCLIRPISHLSSGFENDARQDPRGGHGAVVGSPLHMGGGGGGQILRSVVAIPRGGGGGGWGARP